MSGVLRPAAQGYFLLLVQEKVTKEKHPPSWRLLKFPVPLMFWAALSDAASCRADRRRPPACAPSGFSQNISATGNGRQTGIINGNN